MARRNRHVDLSRRSQELLDHLVHVRREPECAGKLLLKEYNVVLYDSDLRSSEPSRTSALP
jgi:hypothetical protein